MCRSDNSEDKTGTGSGRRSLIRSGGPEDKTGTGSRQFRIRSVWPGRSQSIKGGGYVKNVLSEDNSVSVEKAR